MKGTIEGPAPAIVPRSACRVIHAYGEEITIHLSGRETGGKYTMFSEITPPGGGPPPHYHSVEDEWFYVLEGRAAFFKDGAWAEVPPGTTVFMPRNTVHTFKNVGDTPLKQIIHAAPSGIEEFFARSEAEFSKPGGPQLPVLMKIGEEHGIHFLPPETAA